MITLLSPDNPYAGVNLVTLLVIVLLSTAFFICFSGFIKYSIVLNIIKNAIGTQQIPPGMVVNLLAGLMALNSIWPEVQLGLERIEPYFNAEMSNEEKEESKEILKDSNKLALFSIVTRAEEFFPELFEKSEIKAKKLLEIVDLPLQFNPEDKIFKYFIGSLIYDLYKGFELGLKLYIIFVSIDFLVAVILSGVGMTMLSPTVVSTPLKLSVFYFSDSWTVLFTVMQ
ncbi:EscR/YscR/HrcR family type III secretion system export apparatus protein [Vibrio aquaticus]|uniref:EscR/YscR/HrcR family type III secretion system export apparatus protein n=1 Tax=Vibrio aquaticus TaxID=2496559 RepID=A0A3S0MJY1_9VIBR|nr:EscR/YscR/HrcR family type III secretion system export apparatus protein [Vibrio aquaticus]RTZ16633.1 EscR/YscR/HrcR family type III secretion system export apparatus protein [Vibrio aquaticus]